MGKGQDSRASYDKLEKAGRGPTQRERDYFVGKFGEPTDQDRQVASSALGETPDLATALVDLTAEVAAMRRERVALWRGLAVALSGPGGERVAEVLRDALAPLLPAPAPQPQTNGHS